MTRIDFASFDFLRIGTAFGVNCSTTMLRCFNIVFIALLSAVRVEPHVCGHARSGRAQHGPTFQFEGLMNGTERPRFPDLSLGRSTFKRTAVEDVSGEQGMIFLNY